MFRADLVCNGENLGDGVTGVPLVYALFQVEIAPGLAAVICVLRVNVQANGVDDLLRGVFQRCAGSLVGIARLAAVLPKGEFKEIIPAVFAGDRLAHRAHTIIANVAFGGDRDATIKIAAALF